ncbi:cobalt-zinc-cadmium resistance protein CzcC precursor [mine drainage metagenome]|uniref:Cobalt-zinc-cadmium resistance protein CzcC n=1 Tax=mine drainage metagenome TaxID=410659 RepID=A0A1J5S8P0_9ZZZZ
MLTASEKTASGAGRRIGAMPIARAWILCLLTAALAACARFEPRPLSPQASAARFEARSLADPGLENYLAHRQRRSPAWPPRTWDVDLLTLAALYYHPELEVARAQQQVAEAAVGVARHGPSPSLNFTPGYNADALAGMSPWILGWAADFPIETAGRRGDRERQAAYRRDAARFDLAGAAWRVRSRVRRRMLAYDGALREAALLKQTLKLREDLAAAMQRRLAAGEAARPAADSARAAQAETRLQLNSALGRAATARAALAAAVGVPVADLDTVKLSFAALERPPAAAQIPARSVRRAALANRADLLAALARYEASQSALRLEIARQYPDLRIGPGYQWDQGADKWSLGIGLTLPLFARGRIAQAKAKRKLAAARFTALQARDIARTERALAGYRAALAAREAARSLAATQQSRAQAAQRRFAAGDSDRGALDQAQLRALAAQAIRLNASLRAQRALGALEDAIERPLEGAIAVSTLPAPRRDAPDSQGSRP